jgi:hypothetical protein
VSEVTESVEVAEYYLVEARRLMERSDVHDVAEKVWAAVRSATQALTAKIRGAVAPTQGCHVERVRQGNAGKSRAHQ